MKRQAAPLDLFLRHRAALVDYVTPIVGDRSRAEDVVQEAFFRFVSAEGQAPTAIDRPLAYLYRIVRNLALDWKRRRGVERRQEAAEPLWWMLPDTPRTPEQDLLYRQELARIGHALDNLSPVARRAVEMHRFGGFTLAEIGAELQLSAPTVHRLVRDALVEVASRLGAGPDD